MAIARRKLATSFVAAIAARGIAFYLRLVARRSRFQFFDGDRQADPSALAACLHETMATGSAIFPFWNCDSLVLLTVFAGNPSLQTLSAEFIITADDSFGGSVTLSLVRQLGLRPYLIRRSDPAGRIRDLQSLVSAEPRLVIAVDSHGPYRTVGVATGRLIRRLNAAVTPIAASCTRHVPLFRRKDLNMLLPLPGGDIVFCKSGDAQPFAGKTPVQVCQDLHLNLSVLHAVTRAAVKA